SQAEGALRRSASACRHGPRDRAQPAGLLHGRAAVQPRRQDARADPHGHRQAPGRPRCHHRLRHPRPGRGDDDGRSGRGHEGRLPPAGRQPAEALRQARQPLRRRVHRLAADEPPPGPRQGRQGADRRIPRPGRRGRLEEDAGQHHRRRAARGVARGERERRRPARAGDRRRGARRRRLRLRHQRRRGHPEQHHHPRQPARHRAQGRHAPRDDRPAQRPRLQHRQRRAHLRL
ncbi:MAG: Glycerol-3-phosphate ABC transporter, ATP-binding protein UgpC, partial [uncultured Nocardioides sp.]